MKIEMTFKIEKETKNAVRYMEEAPEGLEKIGALYIKKMALGAPFPQQIKVTVES